MSIRAQASADFRANIARDGEPVTLTSPDGYTTYQAYAQNTRTTHRYDPQTGKPEDAPSWALTIPFSYLPRADSGEFYSLPESGWFVDASDVQDVQQMLVVNEASQLDYTIGFITLICGPVDDRTS